METTKTASVSYSELPHFSELFRTYCTEFNQLSGFYSADFQDVKAFSDVAAKVATAKRHRNVLADVLLEQNAVWGMDDKTRENIERLRLDDTVAVVTGQQVGLFGGPLYTPLKTITAIQLARKMEKETGRPVVPVFWLEGEDHDLKEVATCGILKTNEKINLTYDGHTLPDGGNLGPVGRLRFTAKLAATVSDLAECLPPTEFKAGLLEQVAACYNPGISFRDAFARLIRSFFPDHGLVFISSDDRRLKELAAPLFERELWGHAESYRRLTDVSAALSTTYHAQVHPRETNIFIIEPDGRFALDATAEGFSLHGTNRSFSADELIDRLEREPEAFSANVVLRPLLQDTLLPTAAYIAGPGEVAYFAQFKPLYEWAKIEMPVVFPRGSATLIEPAARRALGKFGLGVADFAQDFESLFKKVVLEQAELDLESEFKKSVGPVHGIVNQLKNLASQVDRSLVGSAEALRATLQKDLDKFYKRLVQAEKRKQDQVRAQLEKTEAALFPGGMQERAVSILYFLNKYGPTLIEDLFDRLSLDTTQHQVIEI